MELIFSKAVFGLVSSAFILVGGIPYLKDIIHRRVKPHILSWLGWGFLTAIGALAMLAEGSTWAVALIFANTVICSLIAVFAIVTKTGVWSTGKQDFILFGVGILGIILWQMLDMPILALICAIIADLAFGIPTIIKTWRDPSTETPFVWSMHVVGEVFGILAIQHFVFYDAAYPIYMFLYDGTVLLLILKIFKRKTPPEQANRAGIHIPEPEIHSPR